MRFKKNSAKIMLVIAISAILMLLGACQKRNDNEIKDNKDKVNKDTLTVVISEDPASVDPNNSDAQPHYQVTRQIYETLFVYDKEFNLEPCLAESYKYEDDETIIIKLRQGVKFHNGEEFKASDVLFTFKRIFDEKLPSLHNISKLVIDKCEAIDDYTLKLVTDGPAPTQLKMFEGPATAIMSEKAFIDFNGDFLNGAACGTGPYKFVSYDPGDKVVLVANENYWMEGQPKINNLVMRIISDSSSRAIEAETGGADIVYNINAKDVKRIRENKNLNLISELGTNTSHLIMNLESAPLDNELVRQAIWYGIDTRSAVKVAYDDYGKLAEDWVSPGIKGDNPEIVKKFPTRDVEKAKQLLAEAGYADGLSLSIMVPSSIQDRCDMAETFQAQLAEIGVDLKVETMEVSAWISNILDSKHQMTIYGFSCPDFEADGALNQLMPTNVNYNLCRFDNKEFQDTVNKAVRTIDNEQRYELYRDASEMLIENNVTLPLWHKELNAVVQNDVKGFELTRSFEHHYLQNVSFE